MKVGTLLVHIRTGGIGEVTAVRESQSDFTFDGIVFSNQREYHIHGRRTNRDIWLKEDSLHSYLKRGILIEWPDELKPKEYIPRYDFQKG